MWITSLTECFEMCRVDAITLRDNPAARSSSMSFTLILLAIIIGLPSVKFEVFPRNISYKRLLIMWSYSVNHMLHGAVARIGGAIKRIEGADGAKYSPSRQ